MDNSIKSLVEVKCTVFLTKKTKPKTIWCLGKSHKHTQACCVYCFFFYISEL